MPKCFMMLAGLYSKMSQFNHKWIYPLIAATKWCTVPQLRCSALFLRWDQPGPPPTLEESCLLLSACSSVKRRCYDSPDAQRRVSRKRRLTARLAACTSAGSCWRARSPLHLAVAQSQAALHDAVDCSTPGFPVLHHPPEFAQTHVHWVGDAIQPSHPLSSPSPPAFNLSQHQGLFQWVDSSHQVTKGLELRLQHQSFQWIFKVDFL